MRASERCERPHDTGKTNKKNVKMIIAGSFNHSQAAACEAVPVSGQARLVVAQLKVEVLQVHALRGAPVPAVQRARAREVQRPRHWLAALVVRHDQQHLCFIIYYLVI